MTEELSIAFSPCPNDTFIFDAMVHNKTTQNLWNVTLLDIEQLNQHALSGIPDVCKVSFGCLGDLLDEYILLPVGAALGHQCGPQVVSASNSQPPKTPLIAIPGRNTTARLLAHTLIPGEWREVFCLYNEIPELLKTQKADLGLIIHETRFTLEKEGLNLRHDLGQLWEDKFSIPIPLGGIVAKRSLGDKKISQIVNQISKSLNYAEAHPEQSTAYTLAHSIEKNTSVIAQHIKLYVNQESRKLSPKGLQAIEHLLTTWEKLHKKTIPNKKQWIWTPKTTH